MAEQASSSTDRPNRLRALADEIRERGERIDSEIAKVSEELSYPGVGTLYKALQQRGVRVTRQQVERVVKGQEQRQLISNIKSTRGRVTAPRKNDRWDLDIIVYVAQPSNDVERILIAQDIFTRRIMARTLRRRDKKLVVGELAALFDEYGTPSELHADGEFVDDKVQKFLDEKDVIFSAKAKGDHLHTSTLDNAIRLLRQGLTREMLVHKTQEWAPLLPKVVNALNNMPREPLLGSNAKDVWEGKNNTIEFDLRRQAAQDAEHNADEREKRDKRVAEMGAFRTMEGETRAGFRRSFKVLWSGEAHQVDKVRHGKVTDSKGDTYETRLVFPVPKSSRTMEVPDLARRGSANADAAKQARLEPFVGPIKARLARNGGKEKTWTLAKYMREDLGMTIKGTLTQNLRLMGFKTYVDSNNESWAALPE